MTNTAAQMVLNKGAETLAYGLADAWTFLDLIHYADSTDRVELLLVARDCCRLKATEALKRSILPGRMTLPNELAAGIDEAAAGVKALDDLLNNDPRIDLLIRGRAMRARTLMEQARVRAQVSLDEFRILTLAASAMAVDTATG